ncbi:hypothetical protein LI291_07030 [Intestinibacillus massiliensis]|nr:hypothetical protein [Intestinibacillus massiliensis]
MTVQGGVSKPAGGRASPAATEGGIPIAGYYDKGKDYSAAIAAETDAGKREQLLSERQNKIDAEGLSGKVASNEAVSTWSGSYRPYYASSGGGGASRGGTGGTPAVPGVTAAGLYEAIERQRLAAFEAAREQNARALERRQGQIDAQYTDSVRQAQVNARLSAMGNEEKLAALGLSAGARYAAPTSGYTESERVRIDNALRGDLNSLAAARDNAKAQAEEAAGAADAALATQDAQSAAQAALQLAQISMQQYNADRDYSLQSAALTGYLNGYPTLETRQYQANLSQAAAQQAQESDRSAYEDAMARWNTYGYVLPADAAVLGVPAGTGTSDQRYRDAQTRLAQMRLVR